MRKFTRLRDGNDHVRQAASRPYLPCTRCFLHIIRGKMCRKRQYRGRRVCNSMPPPGGKSNCTVTPAPCHHDTGWNLSPEDITADRRSLKSYYQQVKRKYLYPSLEEMIPGSSWIDKNRRKHGNIHPLYRAAAGAG